MKKLLSYILIIAVAATSLFAPAFNVSAQPATQSLPVCIFPSATSDTPTNGPVGTSCQLPTCVMAPGGMVVNGPERVRCAPATNQGGSANQATAGAEVKSANALENNLQSCWTILTGNFDGCIMRLFYIFFGTIPAMLLSVAGSFFNVVVPLALSSVLYTKSAFISEAWVVVRDISNIFFIIALLYVALQLILGLGGHHGPNPKKTIAQIVVMALLINFSMFFTKFVVDGTNILALVFYNKINIETKIVNGAKVPGRGYIPALNVSKTGVQDKDIAGAVLSGFDPSRMLSQQFFDLAKKQTTGLSVASTAGWTITGAYVGSFIPVPILGTAIGATGGFLSSQLVGLFVSSDEVPTPLMLGIILISGLIMYFAIYAFFMAGFSFIARMIELWVLIIFSPFAFMSSTIPQLGHIDGIGWDSWLKKLLSTAMFAPVFMFFMYLIFKLVDSAIFKDLSDRTFDKQGTLEAIVLIIIPAVVILTLLKQATAYAKKGGGQIGEMLVGGAKALGVLAVGGAAVGAAGLGRGLIGRNMAAVSQTDQARHVGQAMFNYNNKLEKWKKGGKKTPKPSFASEWRDYRSKLSPEERKTLKPRIGALDKFGGRINAAQLKVGEVGHARHELDDLKKKLHLDAIPDQNLTGAQLNDIYNQFAKDNRNDTERYIKRGYDGKNKPVVAYEYDEKTGDTVKNAAGVPVTVKDENTFMNNNRAAMAAKVIADAKKPGGATGDFRYDPATRKDVLTDQGERKREEQLRTAYTDRVLRPNTERIIKGKYGEIKHEAEMPITTKDRALSRSTSGSYDFRNLVNASADKRDGIGLKTSLALVAAVATGIRAGMKGVGVDAGKPQKDMMSGLKEVINTAMKNVKLDVNLSGGGHGGGDHGHGGGHDDHGAAAGHH